MEIVFLKNSLHADVSFHLLNILFIACDKGNKGCQGMQARLQNSTVCVVPENIHFPWRAVALFALDRPPPWNFRSRKCLSKKKKNGDR